MFTVYLFFSNGECADAFTRYGEIFGAEASIMRMSDVPDDQRMPGSDPEHVMHASLEVGDARLMGSDDPTGDGGPRLGFSISYTAADTDGARTVFAALAEGGEVTMDLEPAFWSPLFGTCTDRFGVPWMIDVMPDASPEHLTTPGA